MKKFLPLLLLLFAQIDACTGIRIQAKDGTIISARTLEFGSKAIQTNVIMVPRNISYTATAPNNQKGATWKTKHAFVGASIFDTPYLLDGVNEGGLYVGLFYFPDYVGYQTYNPKNQSNTLAPWELGTWILSLFSSVEELLSQIDQMQVVDVVLPQMGITPPVHFYISDLQGDSVVLEYTNGQLNVYDNTVGTITNSPGFPWQTTNLNNYIDLTATNHPSISLSGMKLTGFGQGSGMIGLPGDFTPTSRFVRATALNKSHVPFKNADEAIHNAFHILNSFDIPKGAVRQEENGQTEYEITLFTSCANLSYPAWYFHTHENRQVRVAVLEQFDVDGSKIIWLPMDAKGTIQNISPKNKSN